jgi:hypothetical protein
MNNNEPQSQCLTPKEKLYIRDKISNDKLKLFLELNKFYQSQMACEDCEAYMTDLIKARTMRHEVN